MTKRKPKSAKELKIQQDKEAIRSRLVDILYGAQGEYYFGNDPESDEFYTMELGMDVLSRLLGGIKHMLPEDKHFLLSPRYLEQFDNLDSITELLYQHDFRA